jgi:hypothetical protein
VGRQVAPALVLGSRSLTPKIFFAGKKELVLKFHLRMTTDDDATNEDWTRDDLCVEIDVL